MGTLDPDSDLTQEQEKSQAGGSPNLALATPLLTGYRFLPSAFLLLGSSVQLLEVSQGIVSLAQYVAVLGIPSLAP